MVKVLNLRIVNEVFLKGKETSKLLSKYYFRKVLKCHFISVVVE